MPRPGRIRFLDRTATFYDPAVYAFGFRRLWSSVAEWAAQRAGSPCLDVCTGTGGVARAMARRGGRVVGCDISPGMLRHARRRARAVGLSDRADWVRMDARRIACRDASFPLVVCAMSLHEMSADEIRQVLAEIRRVSSDEVVVADYQLPSAGWRRLLFWFFKVFERLESEDFDGFMSKGLRERLEAAGLVVEAHWDTGLYRVCRCSVRGSPDS